MELARPVLASHLIQFQALTQANHLTMVPKVVPALAQLKSWALLQDLVLPKAPLMHSRISLEALSQATKRAFKEEALEVDMVDMVDIVDLDSDSEKDSVSAEEALEPLQSKNLYSVVVEFRNLISVAVHSANLN